MVRQRDEAIILYEKGNRPELALQEKEEIIIQESMPEQLADADIESAVINAIKSIGAVSLKDMGSVMANLRKNYSGQNGFKEKKIYFGCDNEIFQSLIEEIKNKTSLSDVISKV